MRCVLERRGFLVDCTDEIIINNIISLSATPTGLCNYYYYLRGNKLHGGRFRSERRYYPERPLYEANCRVILPVFVHYVDTAVSRYFSWSNIGTDEIAIDNFPFSILYNISSGRSVAVRTSPAAVVNS